MVALPAVARPVPREAFERLAAAGLSPVLARVLASRGVTQPAELDDGLQGLAQPDAMLGLVPAARLLADAIEKCERICVVGDYDCDGATGSAVAVRGLRMMGAVVDYLVPNRFEHGYGLSPPLVALAAAHPRLGRPDWLLTVDSGIASVEGVLAAKAEGLRVIITDHHLPGQALPAADAIVNPNQPGCGFPSRNLAGVGVVFYLLAALRAEFRRRAPGGRAAQAPLPVLLDLVALGTVADLVRLDRNNRLLVAAGLRRIRAGQAQPGIAALLRVAGRDAARVGCADLGFALGPRINAAGRLEDAAIGIECLLTDDPAAAEELAGRLDAINRERRRIEGDMREQALADLDLSSPQGLGVVLHRPDWHEGVIGLVASRVKDQVHRPTIALAPSAADSALLRGSCRSIPGVHLRDVLDLVDKRSPGLLLRFGGHAMAAGLSMHACELPRLQEAFEAALKELADPGAFERQILTDGPLADESELGLALADVLESRVWGQGFPEPLFCDEFVVLRQATVGSGHLRLTLKLGARPMDAIFFGRGEPLPQVARLVYKVVRDEWQGRASLKLHVEALAA